MTFAQLIKKVEKRVRYESPELRYRIKDFINEAILEFMDIRDWAELVKSANLTTDDSGSYTLASIVGSDYFYGTVGNNPLIRDGKNDTEKYFRRTSYQQYINATPKTRLWAINQKSLYIDGTGQDLTLFYLTPGEEYPMSADDDTNLVTENYADIIEQATIVKFHIWEGDNDMAGIENSVLNNKIKLRKSKELRDDKKGQMFRVGYANR